MVERTEMVVRIILEQTGKNGSQSVNNNTHGNVRLIYKLKS